MRRNYYNEALARYFNAATAAGLNYAAADGMRRDAVRLHTWSEHECNGTKQRAEAGDLDHRGRAMTAGATYYTSNTDGPGPIRYYRTPDLETGALRRITETAASIGASVEFQGDPRGWPVTVTLADGRTQLSPPVR